MSVNILKKNNSLSFILIIIILCIFNYFPLLFNNISFKKKKNSIYNNYETSLDFIYNLSQKNYLKNIKQYKLYQNNIIDYENNENYNIIYENINNNGKYNNIISSLSSTSINHSLISSISSNNVNNSKIIYNLNDTYPIFHSSFTLEKRIKYLLLLHNSIQIIPSPHTSTLKEAISSTPRNSHCNFMKLWRDDHAVELHFPHILIELTENSLPNIRIEENNKKKIIVQEKKEIEDESSENELEEIKLINLLSMIVYKKNLNYFFHNKTINPSHNLSTQYNSSLPNLFLSYTSYHDYFSKPLFYFVDNKFQFVSICLSQNPSITNGNWKKGRRYSQELADEIINKSCWIEENEDLIDKMKKKKIKENSNDIFNQYSFISLASHPINSERGLDSYTRNEEQYLSHSSFFRVDYDIGGDSRKDIIIPYYVLDKTMYIKENIDNNRNKFLFYEELFKDYDTRYLKYKNSYEEYQKMNFDLTFLDNISLSSDVSPSQNYNSNISYIPNKLEFLFQEYINNSSEANFNRIFDTFTLNYEFKLKDNEIKMKDNISSNNNITFNLLLSPVSTPALSSSHYLESQDKIVETNPFIFDNFVKYLFCFIGSDHPENGLRWKFWTNLLSSTRKLKNQTDTMKKFNYFYEKGISSEEMREVKDEIEGITSLDKKKEIKKKKLIHENDFFKNFYYYISVNKEKKSLLTPPSITNFNQLTYLSEFCLIIRGDTRSSSRLFTSINWNCIPVIISDYSPLPFENFLNYTSFSIRLDESYLNNSLKLIKFLLTFPNKKKIILKRNLNIVKPFFLYEINYYSSYYLLNPVTFSLFDMLENKINECNNKLHNWNDINFFCQRLLKKIEIVDLIYKEYQMKDLDFN